MDDNAKLAYLAAFLDGEGHIGCHMTGRGRVGRAIAFYNTDRQLLDRVVKIAADVGFIFRVHPKKNKMAHWAPGWSAHLIGGKEAVTRFLELVPIQADRKLKVLQEIVDSYAGPERLEAIYASRRTSITLSCKQCGKPFSAFPADIERNHGKFCSRKCGAQSRATKIDKVCVMCGATFWIYPHRKETAKFCSPHCAGLNNSDRLRAQAKRASDARWRRPVASG
jgi:hypothetical protein